MSEAADVQPQAAEDSTPGAILKRERERRALSLQQAADELHLDTWIVEAIEANRFVTLGAPVYARGHLRKYATRLGLPPEEIIDRYERLQDRPMVADPIPAALADPVRPPRRSFKGPAWAVVGAFALASIAWVASEFLATRSMKSLLQNPIASISPASKSDTAAPVEAARESVPESSEAFASAADSPAASDATPAGPEAAPAPAMEAPEPPSSSGTGGRVAAAAEPIQIRLEFSGESWTEIYDATGTRLMYAPGTAGRVRTLSGVPPLQVNLGSVSAVSLQVNGEPVAIPRRDGRESSRFVIEADGNLR